MLPHTSIGPLGNDALYSLKINRIHASLTNMNTYMAVAGF